MPRSSNATATLQLWKWNVFSMKTLCVYLPSPTSSITLHDWRQKRRQIERLGTKLFLIKSCSGVLFLLNRICGFDLFELVGTGWAVYDPWISCNYYNTLIVLFHKIRIFEIMYICICARPDEHAVLCTYVCSRYAYFFPNHFSHDKELLGLYIIANEEGGYIFFTLGKKSHG